MELPVFSHEGLPATDDQAGRSEHVPAFDDDYVIGDFGALVPTEYWASVASSSQYDRASQLGLGGAIGQRSQPGQSFIDGTWDPVIPINPGCSYFNGQQLGYEYSFNNANLTVQVSDGNTACLIASASDQSTDIIWPFALEPQCSDQTSGLISPNSHKSGLHFNEPNIYDPLSGASSQTLPYGIASHTDRVPLQFSTPVLSSHGPQSLVTTTQNAGGWAESTSPVPVAKMPPCATCWGRGKKCEGLIICIRCQKKGIPKELCIRVRLQNVLTFAKYLNNEYKTKVVYTPYNKSKEKISSVFLRHDLNGYPVEVKCYRFVLDLVIPHQATTFWQGSNGYEEIETTTWSLTEDYLDVDLKSYFEKNVPVFVQRACNGPRETAVIFQQASKFKERPIISLGLKIHVALKMLMKGWSISGDEHLGMPTLHAEGAPCDGEIPVPAVMERQLDHLLENLLAKWESDFCKEWESLAKKKKPCSWRTELFLATFLILHVMERDALRLKIRFRNREAMNGWKHPSTPTHLVEKTICFCNTLLAHFRALQAKDPLRSDCLEEDLQWYAGNDPTAFDVMQTLRKHKIDYLDSKPMDQKFCDRYKPGDNGSCDFTWSAALFGSSKEILMKDYVGKGVPGWWI